MKWRFQATVRPAPLLLGAALGCALVIVANWILGSLDHDVWLFVCGFLVGQVALLCVLSTRTYRTPDHEIPF